MSEFDKKAFALKKSLIDLAATPAEEKKLEEWFNKTFSVVGIQFGIESRYATPSRVDAETHRSNLAIMEKLESFTEIRNEHNTMYDLYETRILKVNL